MVGVGAEIGVYLAGLGGAGPGTGRLDLNPGRSRTDAGEGISAAGDATDADDWNLVADTAIEDADDVVGALSCPLLQVASCCQHGTPCPR